MPHSLSSSPVLLYNCLLTYLCNKLSTGLSEAKKQRRKPDKERESAIMENRLIGNWDLEQLQRELASKKVALPFEQALMLKMNVGQVVDLVWLFEEMSHAICEIIYHYDEEAGLRCRYCGADFWHETRHIPIQHAADCKYHILQGYVKSLKAILATFEQPITIAEAS